MNECLKRSIGLVSICVLLSPILGEVQAGECVQDLSVYVSPDAYVGCHVLISNGWQSEGTCPEGTNQDWDWGDGTVENGDYLSPMEHEYAQDGIYTLTVRQYFAGDPQPDPLVEVRQIEIDQCGDRQYFLPHGEEPTVNGGGNRILMDLDFDGDLDVIIGVDGPVLPLTALRREPDGTYTDQTLSLIGSVPIQSIRDFEIADLNGDGRDDLVIVDHGCDCGNDLEDVAQSRILFRQTDGSLTDVTSTNFPEHQGAGHAVTTGDIDGENGVDIIIGYIWGCTHPDPGVSGCSERDGAHVYLNQGSGTFLHDDSPLPLLNHYPGEFVQGWALELFDADNDNDLDLLATDPPFPWTDHWPTTDVLLLNNGNGSYSEPSPSRLPPHPPKTYPEWPLETADFNGDGWQDIVFGAFVYDVQTWNPDDGWPTALYTQFRIAMNRGDGTFEDRTGEWLDNTDFPPFNHLHGVSVFDVNNDLRPDLFASKYDFDAPDENGSMNRLWVNEGDHLADVSQIVPGLSQSAGWGADGADLDGDGDIDFFVHVSSGSNRYFVLEQLEPYFPPLKHITAFMASPNTLLAGESTTVSWQVHNAENCNAQGGPPGWKDALISLPAGNVDLAIDERGCYTLELECVRGENSVSQSINVEVKHPALIFQDSFEPHCLQP